MAELTAYIYSNDGETLLSTIAYPSTASTISITSTGIDVDSTTVFTYSGGGTFNGFSTSADATTPTYAVGSTVTPSTFDQATLYVVLVTADYRPLTYADAKIQVDSAIRDEDGVRIKTNYQKKPQVIEYKVYAAVATGTKCVIAEYYGTYDGSPGYVKFAMEVTSSSSKGIYVIEATWGQATGNITLLSSNCANADVYYAYVYYPSSTSNYAYPPLLAVMNNSTREKQVRITVLESSGNLTWKNDWDTTTVTGRGSQLVTLSYASQVYRSSYTTSATSASYAGYISPSSSTTLPTSNGVRFCTGLTILSKTDTWFIETYTYDTYRYQRATAMSDPSEVAVRTSTDSGTTWTDWKYSSAFWKA